MRTLSRSAPRPWRALAVLAMIILVMLLSVTGKDTFSPGKWHQQVKVGLGLDLSSGTQVELQAETDNGKAPPTGEMQQAINVELARVNSTGISGAQVEQQGPDLINVTVPGKGSQQTLALVGTTARLAFRPVLLWEPPDAGTSTPSPTASPTAPPPKTQALIVRHGPAASPNAISGPAASASGTPKPSSTAMTTSPATAPSPSYYGDKQKVNAATMALFNKLRCTPSPDSNYVNPNWKQTVGYADTGEQYDNMGSQIVSCDASGSKYVLDKAVFQGTDIRNVTPGLQPNTGQWVVDLTLNPTATKVFDALTTDQYNNHYVPYQASGDLNSRALAETAVVLDGAVQSAELTTSVVPAGQVEITGAQGNGSNGFTQDQATQLADVLKYGSLPLNFKQLSVNSISAQLGHDSLVAGLMAGVIGLAAVITYLFSYYRGLGLVSVSSLLTASLLAYLAVVLLSKYQNFTMELSGIAGLIVAIGITADSFIVFFERLRDEVREGRTLRPAVESGWKRARRTILVSDTVSFLAAVLLYEFSVSDVKGFAYTLGLTTLIDVVVVFLFTKPMVTLLAGTKFFGGGHKWSGLDPQRLGAKNPWHGSRRGARV
ncbi:MAG TPA: protein translocase subunit SecD [Trebonia sp.]